MSKEFLYHVKCPHCNTLTFQMLRKNAGEHDKQKPERHLFLCNAVKSNVCDVKFWPGMTGCANRPPGSCTISPLPLSSTSLLSLGGTAELALILKWGDSHGIHVQEPWCINWVLWLTCKQTRTERTGRISSVREIVRIVRRGEVVSAKGTC